MRLRDPDRTVRFATRSLRSRAALRVLSRRLSRGLFCSWCLSHMLTEVNDVHLPDRAWIAPSPFLIAKCE
eukprot:485182-Alexandrium_andersonii.AAC.1